MERFVHLTVPEMGHGLIALAVFAAALPVLISIAILLVLARRMVRARLGRMRQKHTA